MQLINIYPIGNLGCEYSQNMHMFLTHMVENHVEYTQVAKDVAGYKILDNSVIELGNALSIGRILAAAEVIGADEIILPDVYCDGPRTLDFVKRAMNDLDRIYGGIDNCPYKLMAVAQGETIEEWIECYTELLFMEHVDVIGIPKVLAKMHPGGRPYVVNSYCQLNIKDKQHHLLGVWYSLTEFKEYHNLEAIRSCDTVLPAYLAKYRLEPEGVRADGFTLDLERDTAPNDRLTTIKMWCKQYYAPQTLAQKENGMWKLRNEGK